MYLAPGREEILQSFNRISPYIHHTPVFTNSSINKLCKTEIFFKCENFQKVGAFKMRGAINAVLGLQGEERSRGVATHSSGNHAQALALAAKINNIKAYMVMPRTAPLVKKKAVEEYGAEVILCEPTLQAREQTLQQVVSKTGAVFIPPYNDYRIIEGQATCAYEFLGSNPDLDYIFTPLGGGGLLSGTALAAKYFSPQTQVIGCEPEGANDGFLSLKNNAITPLQKPHSIADGLLTTIGTLTFPIIKENVKEILVVNDKEISDAVKLIWERMKIIVEASGAVPLAAIIKNRDRFKNKKIGIIISGGNVDFNSFRFL